MSSRKRAVKHPLQLDDGDEGEAKIVSLGRNKCEESAMELEGESSGDEAQDGENAPRPLERQRDAAVARMQRLFGLDLEEMPTEPLVQDDDSNYQRRMYWTCIQDSGFPNRVNHAVAAHRCGVSVRVYVSVCISAL